MNLVIVESPTKAKTISKFLGKDYQVESSFGHVRDLPKSKLGIDVEKNFEPSYIIPMKARAVVKNLRAAAEKSENIILATDEDREGEAIAWHLEQALIFDKPKAKTKSRRKVVETVSEVPAEPKNIQRIVFHEITKSAIENALQHPRAIKLDLVNAQQARRVLDRLVGYKLSPFLWKKIVGGLSAGRVQSVTVRLIVDRENEIRIFKPQEYWTIIAQLKKAKLGADSKAEIVEAHLVKIGEQSLEKFDIANQEAAEKISEDLKQQTFVVAKVTKKEASKTPLAPFITSTLQQESAKRLGFSSKKTMFIAQRLYEHGLITYMRTDSINLSQEALSMANKWLGDNLGGAYVLPAPRIFMGKSRLAQEAHEAIRPTNAFHKPEELEDAADQKLYRLIWQRFIASQMPVAKVAMTSVDIFGGPRQGGASKYILRATGQQIVFDGYLKIWPQKFSENTLPPLDNGEKLDLKEVKPEQHFTEPAARYSEATLIKALEEHGIGRPSTYAPTISVIQTRNYVKKEKGRFSPTETGELVNKVLTEHFPQIVDIDFTAKMEGQLDEVAHGREKWQELIGNFYGPFEKNLEEKYAEVSKKELVPEEKTDQVCEKCGKPMIIKFGRFGKFIACSGFPDCKNTKQLAKESPKLIGMKCPKCIQGDIIERKVTKGRARGKIFWGCSKYPDCDYASWTNPLNLVEEKKDETPAEEVNKEEKSVEKD
ncbi:MAG: DNA topoisomerase I [Candidatus Harrisonbacteria bacterium RIFCSPLOWO2_02_FULL_41_13b]|uniref:DNA topoisomerase 1 n=1 Tax=Candidatus Harrisonbacteria bacterium RIFCSPLOWO2_02_FULL_41_13b TaxID=1798409 RepID=A0A1G1ZS07_9BACT|nr:MAG: DNA topoisomerase I [Candidatus Harrisonbacteria bacterium RIFCSPHIGHO2_02_FULL_40_20]OGY67261.1 MAG: DNA topoisomerase I [Candidatus Harrisonbacteria bacterium RIFCSPLOWO2_02_FULL_41_13b]